MKTIYSLLLVVLNLLYFSPCYAVDVLEVLTPTRETKITYQVLDEDRLLVSVLDAEENPIRGLTAQDFVVRRGAKDAKILSAHSLETSREVPLNIVLVVDNSFSMKKREAVDPLLAALEEFLKTVRPIDNIHAVVFAEKEPMKVGKYSLHTKAFRSTEKSELRDFLGDAFRRGITSGTYLYEAMVAGIDLIRQMPEKDQKFLVVFSDGEDINSALTKAIVESEAAGIRNFEAYSVDYMPTPKLDPFLTSFAETHGGRIWKAKSAKELVPIFQSFTTTVLYRYVVNYRLSDPPRGTVTMEPAELSFDILTMIGGAPLMNTVFFETGKSEVPGNYVLFTTPAQTRSFSKENLTTALDRYYNILNLTGHYLRQNPSARIRLIGCNSHRGVEKDNLDLSNQRAETVKDYLSAMWEIDPSRMEIEKRNLPANPTPMIVLGGSRENQRVEIVFESTETREAMAREFFVEANGTEEIQIKPEIVANYGLATWELTLLAGNRTIKTLKGTDDLEPSYTISLDELDREKLATFNGLQARIKVIDIHDDIHETTTAPHPIRVSKRELVHELVGPPIGSVILEPETLTIEELTTIDSSPLLNYVFFETGMSEISRRYAMFTDQADAKTFDENRFRGTMEKYYHTLNIIGKRLVENPESRIEIIGCNSNRGVERDRIDLSRSRAEAVRAYLRYMWGIESWRMEVASRNLPTVASTGSVEEGRAENQRVEIHSESPGILGTVDSTYVQEISDTRELRILPQIEAGYDFADWTVRLRGDGALIESLEGDGDLLPAYIFNLDNIGLHNLGAYKNIQATIEVVDKKGQVFQTADSSSVQFIRKEERVAQKMGYRVLEKYALILFDFDRADIREGNKAVLDRISERISEIPDARVTIVGHTDTIGSEEYNIALSQRRAKAAYDQILATGVTGSENVTYTGAGPHDPLYDNGLPEGRALNRTVTVTLEYEKFQ
jgi:outer membrane protein OmpA-like peptidoglycan-associated protein